MQRPSLPVKVVGGKGKWLLMDGLGFQSVFPTIFLSLLERVFP